MAVIYASRNPEPSAREIRNGDRARVIAGQCMVLLKNNGILPLPVTEKPIALFGSGARRTVKGGTGSGDVNTREVYSVEKGLQEAGFAIGTTEWLDRYDKACEEHLGDYMKHFKLLLAEKGQGAILDALENPYRDPDVPEITKEDLAGLSQRAAIYVIARVSGEGSDRRVKPGDYELSEGEIRNLRTLEENFETVIVVLNTGGVIDTKFLRNEPGIGAILLMSQTGNTGGLALADVLTGKATPSGRLAATWAEDYEDYPSAETFGHRNGDLSDEYYEEGIFVGYRWFDSFGKNPAYPFGFGLSYTDFSMETERVTIADARVHILVKVTNIGNSCSGRETVQVYVSQPAGNLQKPYQVLAGFAKTKLLSPHESTAVMVEFPVTALASYDEKAAAWVLEKGEYRIRVGENSRDTHIAAVLTLQETIMTEQLVNRLQPDCMLHEKKSDRNNYFSPSGDDGESRRALHLDLIPEAIPQKTAVCISEPVSFPQPSGKKITMQDVLDGKAPLEELTVQLTDAELTSICVGAARGGFGSTSVIGAASTACPGAAGETTSSLLESRGIVNLILADGPAGLRLSKSFVADSKGNIIPGLGESAMGGLETIFGTVKPERPAGAIDYYQYCTAIPIATALAQSWDPELIKEAGDIVGEEMKEFGVTLWLAPAMNIQRNPLCGRNFEYYSEDPLLSGICAAADTQGVQQHSGCGTCIKHFALNNQEDNRAHNNAHCSERAIREIYLKGFEIAVKEAAPLSVMSSYNLVNGTHTANSYELLTAILRDEWGFQGVVMSDWGTTGGGNMNPAMNPKYGASDPAMCIQAGNDLIMPGSDQDVEKILEARKEGTLSIEDLRQSALRVLKIVKLRMENN